MESIEYYFFPKKPNAGGSFHFNDLNVFKNFDFKFPKFVTTVYDYVSPLLSLIFVDLAAISVLFLFCVVTLVGLYNSIVKLVQIITTSSKLILVNLDDFMGRYLLVLYVHFILAAVLYLNFGGVCLFLKEFFPHMLLFLVFIKFVQLILLPTKLLSNMSFYYIVYIKGSGVGHNVV